MSASSVPRAGSDASSGTQDAPFSLRARLALDLTVVLIGVYVVLDVISQLLPPHYSPISQAESELAVGPYGYVMTVNFVIRGALSASFLVGLNATTRLWSRSRVGVAFLWVWAIGAFLLAAFPADMGTTITTLHGELHFFIAFAAFVGAAVGAVLLTRHFREEERLKGIATVSLAIALLSAFSLVFFVTITPRIPFLFENAYGLIERIFIGSVLLWMLLSSVHLVRVDRIFSTQRS